MLQQAYTPSETGLASFVHASADYDLAPIGIGSMQEQADRLAEFGRNGDIYIVHAAEGETVIPMEVLDANPQVKEMLFAQMRDMGLDPERYVVGNELNSINPDTGMPEFWFRKIWKKVKKVFKKVAPILAVVVGNAILPGIGGIIASMAYTKLSGGSWGDTLKAGVMAYAGGVLVGGIGGLASGAGFMSGASAAAAAPWNAITNLGATFQSGILGSGVGAAGGIPGYRQPAADMGDAAGGFSVGESVPGTIPGESAMAGGGWDPGGPVLPANFGAVSGPSAVGNQFPGLTSGASNVDFMTAPSPALDPSAPAFDPQAFVRDPVTVPGPDQAAAITPAAITPPYDVLGPDQAAAPADDGNWFTRNVYDPGPEEGWLESYLSPNRASIQPDQAKVATDYAALAKKVGFKPTSAGFDKYLANAQPNILEKYGPLTVAGGLTAYAGGALDDPEDPDKAAREAAEQRAREAMSPSRRNALLESDPDRYMIRDLDPYKYRPPPNRRTYQGTRPVSFARAAVPPPYLQNNPGYARYAAADGGFIDGQPRYPRREMLVEGPGTERSDDIPAMLSDGEFVLNSRSVRGADPTGQGNRYRGAQNLYSMMRNFEMRG